MLPCDFTSTRLRSPSYYRCLRRPKNKRDNATHDSDHTNECSSEATDTEVNSEEVAVSVLVKNI